MMDGSRFDDLTRAVATGISRRGALKAILGAAVGLGDRLPRGVMASLGEGPARGKGAGPEDVFFRAGKRCGKGRPPCGRYAPCSANGYCTPDHCRIEGVDGKVVDYKGGQDNQDNVCQICDPASNWEGWSPRENGRLCPPKTALGPCELAACIDGECTPVPADLESCSEDDSRRCCGGVCCDADIECVETGGAIRYGCSNLCLSGVTWYKPGDANPDHDCQVCRLEYSDLYGVQVAAWAPADDGIACGEAGDRVCCNGDCCPPDKCCGPAGICEECGCEVPQGNFKAYIANADDECDLCTIQGEVYAPGTPNPANGCEVCDPGRDPAAWSVAADDSPCGDGSGRVCCAGVCCPENRCCAGGACVPCGCEVAGQAYVAGQTNPANRCQVCDPDRDRFAWSPLGDDLPCAFDEPRVCCGGVCCAAGACCNTTTGACDPGACAPDGCTIDGVFYDDFANNPNNECEQCNASVSATAWSPKGSASCGPTGQQFCNFHGGCCPLGHCPDVTVPGFCSLDFCDGVCVIDGVLYYDERFQPTGGCQICDPLVSQTSWTVVC